MKKSKRSGGLGGARNFHLDQMATAAHAMRAHGEDAIRFAADDRCEPALGEFIGAVSARSKFEAHFESLGKPSSAAAKFFKDAMHDYAHAERTVRNYCTVPRQPRRR
jgi:hypothetical protein